jgi:SOS-response transcriptional repressor LexA
METSEIRLNNLKYWEQKLSRKLLAERAGYSDTNYINQLLTGHENIGSRTARKFEHGLHLDIGWFDLPHRELWGDGISEPVASYNGLRRVPLLAWVTAGNWCDSHNPFEPGDADEWLTCPFDFSDKAFCLEVIGDSMAPEYREGECILVDPAVSPTHGRDVIARTPDNKYAFKRLQVTPEGTYLLALNASHPNRKIQIPEDSHICGVVIGSWLKR